MESYTFSQFPSPYCSVHLALFKNVINSSEIRQRLIRAATTPGEQGETARSKVDFGFIEGNLVCLIVEALLQPLRCIHKTNVD